MTNTDLVQQSPETGVQRSFDLPPLWRDKSALDIKEILRNYLDSVQSCSEIDRDEPPAYGINSDLRDLKKRVRQNYELSRTMRLLVSACEDQLVQLENRIQLMEQEIERRTTDN